MVITQICGEKNKGKQDSVPSIHPLYYCLSVLHYASNVLTLWVPVVVAFWWSYIYFRGINVWVV